MKLSERNYRLLQTLILAGMGIYLLVKILGGTLYFYINDRFLWLVATGAAIFMLLALAAFRRWRATGDHAHHDHAHAHHGHSHGSRWSLLIVALPLLLGFLVPAKPLDSGALAARGITTNAGLVSSGGANQLSVPAVQRSILDWVRAFNYSADPNELVGEPADVVGFVYHDPRLPANQFLVSRFTVTCCVADAFAVGIIVESEDAANWAGNEWVHVQGTMAVASLDGNPAPLVLAEDIKPVPVPPQPYLFP